MDLTTLKNSFFEYLPNIRREIVGHSALPFVHLFEFAGAIGSGKTATTDAVIEMLHQCGIDNKFRIFKLNEDIINDDNKKAIDDFYANGSKDDSQLENTICGNRIQMLIDALNVALNCGKESIIISDRAVEEDCAFIDSLLNKCQEVEVAGRLKTIKLNIKQFLSDINRFQTRIIHHVLYLDPGIDNAIKRIRHRGRPNEQQIDSELLSELTTDPDEFENGEVHVIDNANFDIKETALMAYERIIWEIATPQSSQYLPLHKLLVSFYGVPGSGKSYFVKEMSERLSRFSFEDEGCDPDFCCSVLDQSEERDIMDAQREVYEDTGKQLSPDLMQDWIDQRRIGEFENQIDHFCAFTFTDVGPITSAVFRETTGCLNKSEKNGYSDWFVDTDGGDFDIFVNVVVLPSGGLSEVRQHIKDRGRPGEYEYFTEERLDNINETIRLQINKQSAGVSEFGATYNVMVVCENDYSQASVDKMFHSVMETIRNAVIGYSASR